MGVACGDSDRRRFEVWRTPQLTDVTPRRHSVMGGLQGPPRPRPGGHISDTTKLLSALTFAADRHSTQRREDKDQTPYINHPIAVAAVLAEIGGVADIVTLQAALLHDTIEDTATPYEDLVIRFGREVADIVQEVTDNKSLPKDARKRLQIEHGPLLSPKARLVKLADKICNVRDVANTPPHNWSAERRREYFEWAAAVVESIRGTNSALEREFDRHVPAR